MSIQTEIPLGIYWLKLTNFFLKLFRFTDNKRIQGNLKNYFKYKCVHFPFFVLIHIQSNILLSLVIIYNNKLISLYIGILLYLIVVSDLVFLFTIYFLW